MAVLCPSGKGVTDVGVWLCFFYRGEDSYKSYSSHGDREGGDRYSRNYGEGGDRRDRGYGDRGGNYGDRGGSYGDRGGSYGDRGGSYGDRGGRRDGPSDRGGPPGYSDRGRYGDRGRQDGDRYERGPGRSDGDREDRKPRGDDDRRRPSPQRERSGRPGEERGPPVERPKLQLQPRSKPKEDGEPVATSSIFGGAKPVDTATKEKAIEERLLKEKEGRKEEVKSPRDKPDRPSIFGGAKPVDTAHREREIEERLRKSQEREEHGNHGDQGGGEKEGPSRTGEEERRSRVHSNEG